MAFPVQVFPYKISLNYMRNGITYTSHGPELKCKHSACGDVYLCLAYVSPSENNFIDSHGKSNNQTLTR